MKTTLELPDDLFRQVKAQAALEGRTIRALVAEARQQAAQRRPVPGSSRKVRFPIIKSKRPGTLTPGEVKRAEADMDREVVGRHAKLVRH